MFFSLLITLMKRPKSLTFLTLKTSVRNLLFYSLRLYLTPFIIEQVTQLFFSSFLTCHLIASILNEVKDEMRL